jgi:hypothetical protein
LIGQADARSGRGGSGASAGFTSNVSQRMNTRAGFNSRAHVRGPTFRPPGWRHGRKVGWHGGRRPPGLR